MDMVIDKQNGDVCFREDTHTYFKKSDPDLKYISVTTLIHSFAQPFDKELVSARKALQKLMDKDRWYAEKKSLMNLKKIDESILQLYDISLNDFNREQQKILDDWEKINKEACERGTAIHLQLENLMYKDGKNVNLLKFGIGGKFECRKNYNDLDLEYGVYPEYLIYKETKDGILRLAGLIDLLIKQGNRIIIADYKTNKEIRKKGFFDENTYGTKKMLYPLNNLEDCNFSLYTMLLSTYAWMLQLINPSFIIEDLILIHFDHSGNLTLYHCDYLKTEVERMLMFHKKQIIKQQLQERRKPIEY